MKSLLFIAAVMFLFRIQSASADSLSFESGIGFYFSSGNNTYLLRYRHDTAPLFNLESYYEVSYASWNGPDHAEAAGLARGIRLAGTNDGYLGLTAGLSRISRTTSNLGQPFEFYGRLGYEKCAGRALYSIGWIHYSDAKFLFGWSGPNNSENFVTLSLGMNF
jgi:Lipid A 3-O-deacylase (PagL)